MERMIAQDREIHLVTGHNGSGKSHYFEFLSGLPEYQGPRVLKLSKDAVYVRYYGERTGKQIEDNQDGYLVIYNTITQWDRFYTDELIRVDTERAILVNNIQRVLLDVVMRTRRFHQKPFASMVTKAEHWLGLIEMERAIMQGLLPPDPASRVRLRAVFLFCDFETVRRRMESRWKNSGNDWRLPPSFVEIPTAYPFPRCQYLGREPGSRRKKNTGDQKFFCRSGVRFGADKGSG